MQDHQFCFPIVHAHVSYFIGDTKQEEAKEEKGKRNMTRRRRRQKRIWRRRRTSIKKEKEGRGWDDGGGEGEGWEWEIIHFTQKTQKLNKSNTLWKHGLLFFVSISCIHRDICQLDVTIFIYLV